MDGRADELAVESIGQYISERENPERRSESSLLRVGSRRWSASAGRVRRQSRASKARRFTTPRKALKWLPGFGLALVAKRFDPPLSQQDAINSTDVANRFTPNVTVPAPRRLFDR